MEVPIGHVKVGSRFRLPARRGGAEGRLESQLNGSSGVRLDGLFWLPGDTPVEVIREEEIEMVEGTQVHERAAGLPIGGKPNAKPTKAASRALLAAGHGPRPSKAAKTLNPCRCGCGQRVAGQFRQGHDGRYYSLLKQVAAGKLEFSKLNATMRKEAGNAQGAKAILRRSKH